MKATYYPGCSLEGTARDYAESILGICPSLDIQLEEIPDWNCCGATAAHSIDQRASIELAGRTLNLAARLPHSDLLVPCPMCFNRLKTAAWTLNQDSANRYGIKLEASVPKIWDLANFLATDPMLKTMAKNISKPLKGLKVVCYYGCMANRPPEITEATDFEDPRALDRIIQNLGATPVRCFRAGTLFLTWWANCMIWPSGSAPGLLSYPVRCVRPIWICTRKKSERIGENGFLFRSIILPS
jgi:heterodisulfide reductase subunit B